SGIHSYLDLLFYYTGRDYQLRPSTHPSFMEGRVGQVIVDGVEIGIIGEIHPQVLENWQINMPCSLFEISVEGLL
ncbi:MAG: phenylalanine--tRNA ligase subunit beta, partial [Nitrospirota bacterium]